MKYKFRAWDGKKMHENVVIIDGKAYKRGYFASAMTSSKADAGVPMMFTGLKDRHGVEIYEGDLLTPKHFKNGKFGTVVVSFSKGMYCFEINKPFISNKSPLYKSLNLGKIANNDYEIIGNIYENTELLTSE